METDYESKKMDKRVFRKLRIFLWEIISTLEQKLYPYCGDDDDDYYYEVKNDETGEKYMIMDWIKSFDEKIIRLQDDMIWIRSEMQRIDQKK
jgi:hypothetical protein